MIWVGSFKSLQSALHKPRLGAPLEVHTWLRSEIVLISPFVDWLMSLIARSRCVHGKEEPRNQLLEDSQFLTFEHRRVHHRVTHGFADGRSSMRSAMTRRLFHARTVRQRTALPVEYVPPRTVSQSVMKFPSASCTLAVARKDTMEASPISSSVLIGSSTFAMRWNAAVRPFASPAPSHRTKSSL